MIKVCVFLALSFSINDLWAQAPQVTHSAIVRQPELTESVEAVLKAAHALKPGMTRADVLRAFETEGGLSTRAQNHYVYRACPYIKIDVTFEVPPNGNADAELPSDRILSISRPYLEYSVDD